MNAYLAITAVVAIVFCIVAWISLEIQASYRRGLVKARQAGHRAGVRAGRAEATSKYRAGYHTMRYRARQVARDNEALTSQLAAAMFELSISRPPDPIVHYIAEQGRPIGYVELITRFGTGTTDRVTSLCHVGFLEGTETADGMMFTVPRSRADRTPVRAALPAPSLIDTVEIRQMEVA